MDSRFVPGRTSPSVSALSRHLSRAGDCGAWDFADTLKGFHTLDVLHGQKDMTDRTYKIAVIAGDGIGREVVPAGMAALEKAARGSGVSLSFTELPWGCDYYLKTGRMMDENGFDTAAKFDAIKTATAMLITAKALYPGVFAWRPDNWIDKLSGSDRLRKMIDANAGINDVVGAWQQELQQFRRTRLPYLRYR